MRDDVDPAEKYRHDRLSMRLWFGDVPECVIDRLDDEAKHALLYCLSRRDAIIQRNIVRFANDESALFDECGDHSE